METANGRGRSREAQCSRDRDQGPRWEEGTLADGARQVTPAETPRARALCRAGLGEPEGRAWEGRASGLRLPALASSWRGPVLPSVCDVALALAVGTEPTESPGCASLHLLPLLGFQERAKGPGSAPDLFPGSFSCQQCARVEGRRCSCVLGTGTLVLLCRRHENRL